MEEREKHREAQGTRVGHLTWWSINRLVLSEHSITEFLPFGSFFLRHKIVPTLEPLVLSSIREERQLENPIQPLNFMR